MSNTNINKKVSKMIQKGKMLTANSYVILRNPINLDRNYKAYRFEGRKPCICNWEGCNNVCNKDNNSVKVITPFAPLGLTLCHYHASLTQCYSSENTVYNGKPTQDNITCSCELETSNNTPISRAVLGLTKYGFHCLPTSDSSVGAWSEDSVEHKTPIYHSLQGATKLFGAFESLLDEGYIEMDNTCGSHLHTGTSDNEIDFRYLFSNVEEYFNAFGALYEYLDKMPNEKMKSYFGRGFVGYARTLRRKNGRYVLPKHDGNGKNLHEDRYLSGSDNLYGTGSYDCTQHLLAFNLQHSYSIEFRLARFTSAEQYRRITVVMHNMVIFLRYYARHEITIETLSNALVALFKECYPY